MIEVTSLTKRYGQNTAVENLSFTVEKGCIYGFLGPNGAGKSTTMNILTGYLSASEGSVKIGGFDVFEEPVKAKKLIGYLPEQPPVYPDMTPKEYLYFVAELKGYPKKERACLVDEAMKKTEIESMQNRLIKNLSKGYCQRVGLAGALLGDPEVLILDEPTVGLDPKQITEMRALIGNLKQKHTILLSSHILSEVNAICDKVIILANGQIAALDTPENLSKHMLGKNTVFATVLADKSAVLEALSPLAEDDSLEFLSTETENAVKVKISSASATLQADTGKALMEKGIVCLELVAQKASLEDIFLELTNTQGSADVLFDDETAEILDEISGEEEPQNINVSADVQSDAQTNAREDNHESNI